MPEEKDPYLSTLLEWNYIHRIPVRTIGDKLGISHTQVLKRLQAAEGFIDGCLAALNVPLRNGQVLPKENVYPPAMKKLVEFQRRDNLLRVVSTPHSLSSEPRQKWRVLRLGDREMMHCPECQSAAHTRSSRMVTEQTKERYHQCRNLEMQLYLRDS